MAIWQGSGAQLGGETPVYVVSHTGSPAGKKKKKCIGEIKKKKKKRKKEKRNTGLDVAVKVYILCDK